MNINIVEPKNYTISTTNLSAMVQCTYTTKDVLSMLDEDSEDDFEGYIDEEEYADRYQNSDAETESSGNSDNEEEMEEDISEIASADEIMKLWMIA